MYSYPVQKEKIAPPAYKDLSYVEQQTYDFLSKAAEKESSCFQYASLIQEWNRKHPELLVDAYYLLSPQDQATYDYLSSDTSVAFQAHTINNWNREHPDMPIERYEALSGKDKLTYDFLSREAASPTCVRDNEINDWNSKHPGLQIKMNVNM